ncbi:MAG: DUF1501 domain-containing protein, partial [Acidimicrobiales bacterium]|nr:DUF1501 domain-containing protein [Acidimicrobiales bacterium]
MSSRPSTPTLLDPTVAGAARPAGGLDRRRFLQGTLAVGGVSVLLPSWLVGLAGAAPLGADDRILVVITLAGGNDGLDTVGPFGSGAYNDARGPIAVSTAGAHAIGNGYYLHPNLSFLKSRWDAGQLAIVQGVGHEADDHSHFSSMARWMNGSSSNGPWTTGWVGRWLDGAGLDGLGGVVIGDEGVPRPRVGPASSSVAVPTDGPLFGASTESWEVAAFDCLQGFAGGSSTRGQWGDVVGGAMAEAIDVSRVVDPVFASDTSDAEIVRDLQLAARVINLDAGARVLGVNVGDFDTHDDHAGRHPVLMSELNAAIAAFYMELNPAFANRVAIMTVSEFGRRVRRNGSGGTDHGTASVALLLGNSVAGGTYGAYPSLTGLDNRGDLKHTVDFRSLYASVLEGWLGADPVEVIGAQYETFTLFRDVVPNDPGAGGGGGGGTGGGGGGAGGGLYSLQALSPARVLDTRSGVGVRAGKVSAGEWVDLPVVGRGGVPSSGVGSV